MKQNVVEARQVGRYDKSNIILKTTFTLLTLYNPVVIEKDSSKIHNQAFYSKVPNNRTCTIIYFKYFWAKNEEKISQKTIFPQNFLTISDES